MSSEEAEVQAITVVAPGEIELRSERPWKGPLGVGEVFGRTVCTLVSPGTELAGAFRPDPARETRYPTVPGYAAVFEVEEMGADVAGVALGDLVFTHGGHRSHQRKPESEIFVVPDGLDPFEAVFARLLIVPMTTLTTTAARAGARVGVSGLGPIGYFAAVTFAASGYDVTAWDPIEERRSAVPGHIPTLSAAPQPGPRAQYGTTDGFDLVLECSGHDGAALDAVKAVRSGGEVVLVGSPWSRRTDATAHDLLVEVFHRYVVLRSGWEWQIPAAESPFVGPSAERNTKLAMRWLADGIIDVRKLATRHQPAEAQSVFEALANRTAPAVTALFDWR
jgi:threonine dehydrogenase-like Zn-dependent dehydrogenase